MSVSGLRENRTSRSKGRGWKRTGSDYGRVMLKATRETGGHVRCPPTVDHNPHRPSPLPDSPRVHRSARAVLRPLAREPHGALDGSSSPCLRAFGSSRPGGAYSVACDVTCPHEVDEAGSGRHESTGIEVEARDRLIEVDVQPSASCRFRVSFGDGNQLSTPLLVQRGLRRLYPR
jgi:hypothetical protein